MGVERHTLPKKERITGKRLVDQLFGGGVSRSMAAYPLRAVYCLIDGGEVPVRMLVSVPKRCFKRAVRRNRIKRQVREAFRHCKHLLDAPMAARPGKTLAVAFVWLDDQQRDSDEVARRVKNLLTRIAEKL